MKSNYESNLSLQKGHPASNFNRMSSSFASLRASRQLIEKGGPAATIALISGSGTEKLLSNAASAAVAFKTVKEGGYNTEQARSQSQLTKTRTRPASKFTS